MKLTTELLYMNYRAMLVTYETERPLEEGGGVIIRAAMPGGVAAGDPQAFTALDAALRAHGVGALLGMTFETTVSP